MRILNPCLTPHFSLILQVLEDLTRLIAEDMIERSIRCFALHFVPRHRHQDLHYANRTGENHAHNDRESRPQGPGLRVAPQEAWPKLCGSLESEATFLIAQDLETTRTHSVAVLDLVGALAICSRLAEASPERGRQRPIPTCSGDMANARRCLISAVRSSPKSFAGVGPAARLGGRICSRRRIEEISELSSMRRPRRMGVGASTSVPVRRNRRRRSKARRQR